MAAKRCARTCGMRSVLSEVEDMDTPQRRSASYGCAFPDAAAMRPAWPVSTGRGCLRDHQVRSHAGRRNPLEGRSRHGRLDAFRPSDLFILASFSWKIHRCMHSVADPAAPLAE